MELLDLPDDVLILLIRGLSIEALFALRLTCKQLHAFVHHPNYVVSIMKGVAGSTFPPASLINYDQVGAEDAFRWLKDLIPYHLAVIVLDKWKVWRVETAPIFDGIIEDFSEDEVLGIPAESTDRVAQVWRLRVANGWKLVQRLANVSKDVYRSPNNFTGGHGALYSTSQTKVDTLLEPESEHHLSLEHVTLLETEVLNRILALISNWSIHDRRHYVLPWDLLNLCYMDAARDEDRYGPDGRMRHEEDLLLQYPRLLAANAKKCRQPMSYNLTMKKNQISDGTSWLIWFVLLEGVDMFWKQWWSEESRCLGSLDTYDVHSSSSSLAHSTISDSADTVSTPCSSIQWHGPASPAHIAALIRSEYSRRMFEQLELEWHHIVHVEFAIRKPLFSPEERDYLQGRLPALLYKPDPYMDLRFAKSISMHLDHLALRDGDGEGQNFVKIASYRGRKFVWVQNSEWLVLRSTTNGDKYAVVYEHENEVLEEVIRETKGPLRGVPYSIYLQRRRKLEGDVRIP